MFSVKKPVGSSSPTHQGLHVTGEFRVGSNVRVGNPPHSPPQPSCISPASGRKTPTGRKTPNRVHFSDLTTTYSSEEPSSSSRRESSSSIQNYYQEKVTTTTTSLSPHHSPQHSPRITTTTTTSNGGSYPARLSPQPHAFKAYERSSSPVIVVDMGGGRKEPKRADKVHINGTGHERIVNKTVYRDSNGWPVEEERIVNTVYHNQPSKTTTSTRKEVVYSNNNNIPLEEEHIVYHTRPASVVREEHIVYSSTPVQEERIVDVRLKPTQREAAPSGYHIVDHTRHTRRKKVKVMLALKMY